MEKCEDMDVRLGHINAKEVEDIKVQADDDEIILIDRSQALFDFGAEILTTNVEAAAATTSAATAATSTSQATSELQPKTNSEIKTKTLSQMGEPEIGANQNAKEEEMKTIGMEKSLQENQIDKSCFEADEDFDEDENEDYKSRWERTKMITI